QKPASENEQTLKNVLDKIMDQEKEATKQSEAVRKEFKAQCNRQHLSGKSTRASSTNSFNTVSTLVNTAGRSRIFGDTGSSFVPLSKFTNLPHDPLMPDLEDTAEVQNTIIFGSAFDDEDLDTYNSPFADQVLCAEADFNNMEPSTIVSPIPITRVYSIHPKDQIIEDPKSAVQTRGITKKSSREHSMISYIQKQRRSNHKDFQNCLFSYFLSQQEPTKIAQALDDERWVEAMQEELLQLKIQKVWTLVDLPYGKKAIGTKWVYRNKKDERGIVVRNKARLDRICSASLDKKSTTGAPEGEGSATPPEPQPTLSTSKPNVSKPQTKPLPTETPPPVFHEPQTKHGKSEKSGMMKLSFRRLIVWICQILQEISQKRTRERMSDQEAKEIKAEAREIMPQPSTVNCS
ncbi:putative ribonuclease H-like domain-containing protein, partial [Tanacetum coccineum]